MMKFSLFLVFALLVVCATAHAGHDHDHSHDHPHSEDVLVLTSSTFDEAVAANTVLLVEFFAPWCGHCKKLAPEYATAAHNLAGTANIASVDCTVEENKSGICQKYDIKGFPTLKVFKDDGSAPTDYSKGRDAAAIESFMRAQLAPAFTVYNTEAECNEVVSAGHSIVNMIYNTAGESDVFSKTAKFFHGEDMVFAICADANAAAAEGLTQGAVRMYRSFDTPSDFDGEFSIENLKTWVNAESFPLVGDIGPENYQKYMERGLHLSWFFMDPSATNNEEIVVALTQAAKEGKGVISFVKLDGVKWAQHAQHFGINSSPGLVIADAVSSKNFIYSGEYDDAEALIQFVKDFKAGTLQPFKKSAPIPEIQEGSTIEVVGLTFDEIVLDSSKDVFVEFYAPWCGHCKKLAPEWEILGETFASQENVVIAQVDATANDAPSNVEGFPTLMFYPANLKNAPIVYKGERSAGPMAEFVRENAASVEALENAHDEL